MLEPVHNWCRALFFDPAYRIQIHIKASFNASQIWRTYVRMDYPYLLAAQIHVRLPRIPGNDTRVYPLQEFPPLGVETVWGRYDPFPHKREIWALIVQLLGLICSSDLLADLLVHFRKWLSFKKAGCAKAPAETIDSGCNVFITYGAPKQYPLDKSVLRHRPLLRRTNWGVFRLLATCDPVLVSL